MNLITKNAKVFDSMNETGKNPDTDFIRCEKKFLSGKEKSILYIGFGEGQNLIYLLKQGYPVVDGVEASKRRIEYVKKVIKQYRFNNLSTLMHTTNNLIKASNEAYDCVFGWQSLYYNNEHSFKIYLKEIYRVLKPNGSLVVSMISERHSFCKKDQDTAERGVNAQGDCTFFCIRNMTHIEELFCQFRIESVGYYDNDLFGDGTSNHHYVILLKK